MIFLFYALIVTLTEEARGGHLAVLYEKSSTVRRCNFGSKSKMRWRLEDLVARRMVFLLYKSEQYLYRNLEGGENCPPRAQVTLATRPECLQCMYPNNVSRIVQRLLITYI